MKERSKIDELQTLASRLVEDGREFHSLLQETDDIPGLRKLAEDFTPHPEISIAVYRKLEELLPDMADIAAELGFVFWLCGEQEQAQGQAVKAHGLDPQNVQGLLLQAALAREDGEKRRLYEKVLEIEPQNAVAQDNLQELGGCNT